MGHMMQNIQSYVMYEVLETAWHKLESGIKSGRDMDEVLREHSEYLLRLQEGAFLVDKASPILHILNKLFSLVSNFEKTQEAISTLAFEILTSDFIAGDSDSFIEDEDDSEDGDMYGNANNNRKKAEERRHFAKLSQDLDSQLESLGYELDLNIQSLLDQINLKPKTEYAYLWCRLNFNDYFVKF